MLTHQQHRTDGPRGGPITGGQVVPSHWRNTPQGGPMPLAGDTWHRALESVGQKPMRVYDCRHAAATTWLRAGMPLGETARRLGHSVETLVSTYVGALDDEEQVGNQRIDSILG